MRDGKSDWQTRSRMDQKRAMATAAAVYGERCIVCGERPHAPCVVDTCPWAPTSDKPRAKPVQREDAILTHIATEAERRWWEPWFQRWEARGAGPMVGGQRRQQGAQRGWPDCGLVYPGRESYCEVKDVVHRPARDVGRWWVDVELERAIVYDRRGQPERVWQYATGKQTRHGVSGPQAFWLCTLAACGHGTHVAYGAEDALAWLDAQAGPEPKVRAVV